MLIVGSINRCSIQCRASIQRPFLGRRPTNSERRNFLIRRETALDLAANCAADGHERGSDGTPRHSLSSNIVGALLSCFPLIASRADRHRISGAKLGIPSNWESFPSVRYATRTFHIGNPDNVECEAASIVYVPAAKKTRRIHRHRTLFRHMDSFMRRRNDLADAHEGHTGLRWWGPCSPDLETKPGHRSIRVQRATDALRGNAPGAAVARHCKSSSTP